MLYKLFNQNTVELSYSCTSKLGNIVKILNKNSNLEVYVSSGTKVHCKCRRNTYCPLNGVCFTEEVMYCTSVENENVSAKTYIGCTEGQFKRRCYNHTSSFRKPECWFNTTQAKYYWIFKEIKWEKSGHWMEYFKKSRKLVSNIFCKPWQEEKLTIATYKGGTDLFNERSESMAKCKHMKKLNLGAIRTQVILEKQL